jgi:phage terminase Nu1 subunit (DNA packaging protein)
MATVAEAARHLFISERGLHRLIDRGVVARAPRGGYDLDAVRRQYVEHIERVAADRAGGGDELAAERARLARVRADAQEMANEAARDELLPADEVRIAVAAAFARVRAKVGALPARLAPQVVGLKTPAEIKAVLTVGVHQVLRQLANTQVVGDGLR